MALKRDGGAQQKKEEEMVKGKIDKISIKGQPEWRRNNQFIRFSTNSPV